MQTLWREIAGDGLSEATLARELGLHHLTARLLVNRGISDCAAAELFLHPSLSHLHDPFLLPDMDKAARRIADAVLSGEGIFVHGDYDVDGVTSTAVYVRSLTKLGAKVHHRVPHRHQDGYDLKQRAIQLAHELGATLIVTTDCGIQARQAVDYANSLGLCVIVTDHHEPGETLPDAYAIVNPRRRDSTYPFPHLAGVGVAYKTMQAVTRLLRPEWEQAFLTNFLDLVALGTVADVMPLYGENRVLASFGLDALRHTKKVGLRALLDGAGIDTSSRLTADSVGFGLAPRINAVGRLDDAAIALDLLLTTDLTLAMSLVARLNECNRERQIAQRRMLAEAVMQVVTRGIAGRPVLVVADPKWNAGVVGIVAGKLVEQYHRPAIVIGVSEDGAWGKGSARSIEAYDVFAGITDCRELLETCGGHAYAAGLSLSMVNLDSFCEKLCAHAGSILKDEDFVPQMRLDAIIDASEITIPVLEEWEQLQPFGNANPAPQLAARGVKVSQKKRIGKDQTHLKFFVGHAKSASRWQTDCVGWSLAEEWDSKLDDGCEIDLAFVPSINTFQGRSSVQFTIKDIRAAEPTPA